MARTREPDLARLYHLNSKNPPQGRPPPAGPPPPLSPEFLERPGEAAGPLGGDGPQARQAPGVPGRRADAAARARLRPAAGDPRRGAGAASVAAQLRPLAAAARNPRPSPLRELRN